MLMLALHLYTQVTVIQFYLVFIITVFVNSSHFNVTLVSNLTSAYPTLPHVNVDALTILLMIISFQVMRVMSECCLMNAFEYPIVLLSQVIIVFTFDIHFVYSSTTFRVH